MASVMFSCTFALVSGAHAAGIIVHDARNRDIAVNDFARTVSIGGAITEILYALGLESRLVGVDTTSLYPAAALHDKPNVGYMRQISAEGVLGLNPTLILAIQGSGPRETMDILETAKVPLVLVPETFSEDGLIGKIKLVGHAMGVDARAECLSAAVGADLAQLRALRAKVTKPVRVMFVMSLQNGRAMVAGHKTAADEIIRLAGAANAVDDYDGYKIISDEAIVAARPEFVLSIERGKDSLQADAVYTHPGFALTPVAANKSFITMDGLYLLGFGPRTAAAARDLSVKLYPALAEGGAFASALSTANCRQ